MGTPKTPDKTRELILGTALELFSERGYFATSVHDIRKHAGLSTGSIYHHFANKEALARALYDDLVGRMQILVDDATNSQHSSKAKCRAIASALCQAAVEQPRVLNFILHARHREFLPDSPPICSTSPFETMKNIVCQGIEAGEIRPMDLVSASVCIFGGVIRLLHLSLDGVLEKPPSAYLDEVWQASWQGVAN